MGNIGMLIIGLFASILGIMNIRGNISSIHSYNRRKVKEEDRPKYGKNGRYWNTNRRSDFCCILHHIILECTANAGYYTTRGSCWTWFYIVRTIQIQQGNILSEQ